MPPRNFSDGYGTTQTRYDLTKFALTTTRIHHIVLLCHTKFIKQVNLLISEWRKSGTCDSFLHKLFKASSSIIFWWQLGMSIKLEQELVRRSAQKRGVQSPPLLIGRRASNELSHSKLVIPSFTTVIRDANHDCKNKFKDLWCWYFIKQIGIGQLALQTLSSCFHTTLVLLELMDERCNHYRTGYLVPAERNLFVDSMLEVTH